MKSRNNGILFLVAGVLVVFAGLPMARVVAWRHDYGEAEPLLGDVVQPMAIEMKRFNDERGRSPQSLDEIARFSPDRDFSPLRRYPHEFNPTGSRRFFMRVNRRFTIVIDDTYWAQWWQPSPVMSAPTNPK
jgi:hypothetical protein